MNSHFQVKRDASQKWYWILYANNYEELARSSESYERRQGCLHSIKRVKELAPTAPVWDMTADQPSRVLEGQLT